MAIDIFILKADLLTELSMLIANIDSDHDFYLFKERSAALGCYFIPTIDAYGNTVINELQIELLENEIKKLRSDSTINQKTLDTLQQAVDAAKQANSHYILFVGD